MARTTGIQDESFRRWIASLPCMVCGNKSQAAHIRRGGDGGMGKGRCASK